MQEAKATDDGSLTEGMFVAYSFKLGFERPSEVYCPSWDAGSQDWMNNTALGPISECVMAAAVDHGQRAGRAPGQG